MSQENQTDSKKLFAPTKEEQTLLKLQGKCPHSEGYQFISRYGEDIYYKCKTCDNPLWL